MARSGTDLKMAKLLASAAICQKWGCYRLVSRATVIENKVETLTITTFLFPSKKVLQRCLLPATSSILQDALFFNLSDYSLASPDYVLVHWEKLILAIQITHLVFVPKASPTLSLFHDDPYYMKVMHEYYAKESPIPPPTIIGESSRKTTLERHEKQIVKILNHLDELSLDRIEHIEDKIEGLRKGQVSLLMPPKRTSASKAPGMTQAAIRKLVADSVTAALEAQAANMANTDNTPDHEEALVPRNVAY
ncbi:hypothetical protein Tco_0720769 [Tanacetum coccineum]